MHCHMSKNCPVQWASALPSILLEQAWEREKRWSFIYFVVVGEGRGRRRGRRSIERVEFFFLCFVVCLSKKRTPGRSRICFFSTQCDRKSRALPSQTDKNDKRTQGRRREVATNVVALDRLQSQSSKRPPSPSSSSSSRGPPFSLESQVPLSSSRAGSHLIRHDVFRAEGLAGLLEAGLGAGVGVVAHCL